MNRRFVHIAAGFLLSVAKWQHSTEAGPPGCEVHYGLGVLTGRFLHSAALRSE